MLRNHQIYAKSKKIIKKKSSVELKTLQHLEQNENDQMQFEL